MQTLKTIQKDNYIIIQLNRPKVNAINQTMINELLELIKSVENDEKNKGMILTGLPNFFSAGLDVKEIFPYSKEEIKTFFSSFFKLHINLVKFKKPFVCAINGYSPAGGTIFNMAADYRIMAEGKKFVIGLNEMAVNIQVPQVIADGYRFLLGNSKANEFMLNGDLLSSKKALEVGLIQDIATQEQLLELAEKQMQKYLSADEDIFINTKRKLRRDWLLNIDKDFDKELEETLNLWWKPEVRAKFETFVKSLTKK